MLDSRERPLGVLADDGVGMRGEFLQLGDESRIARIPHRHAQIAQPAAVLGAPYGRMAEGLAKLVLGQRR
jgi:hypothetical protein